MGFDIDIDVKSHTKKSVYGVPAAIYNEDQKTLRPHPSGYYVGCDNVPIDPLSGLSSFDHKDGDDLGYVKVDLLTNTSYDSFKTREELLEAIEREPDWSKLLDREYVEQLPQLANHFEIVELIEPKSVDDLADVLALIRPGKDHLIESYLEDKEKVRENLFRKPRNGYYYKKSHAYGTALMLVAYMNSIDSKSAFVF